MKILSRKKTLLFFYALDIFLLFIIAVFLLPFSKKNNTPESITSAFLDSVSINDITQIDIINKNKKCKINIYKFNNKWIGTDSLSNWNLFWPVDEKNIENFLLETSKISEWKKKATKPSSWEKLGVDSNNAIEIRLKNNSKTISSIFFGWTDELTEEVYFRTSKNSTVWQTKTQIEKYIYNKIPSFWADPYLIPTYINNSSNYKIKLRRGELVYIKPAEHIKPIKVIKLNLNPEVNAIFSFYEKDENIVVIPNFFGDEYLKKINYRYTISKWTYEEFLKEIENENQ